MSVDNTTEDIVIPEYLLKQLIPLVQMMGCMSYNDSYFGEPEGSVKRLANELGHWMDKSGIDRSIK